MVGVDIDLDMVSAALSRGPGLRGHIAFADLAALPVRRSGFGSAHAAHVFHLFPDARPVLDELLRVTRPGGRLLVNFGAGRQPPPDGIDVAALTRYFTTQLGGEANLAAVAIGVTGRAATRHRGLCPLSGEPGRSPSRGPGGAQHRGEISELLHRPPGGQPILCTEWCEPRRVEVRGRQDPRLGRSSLWRS